MTFKGKEVTGPLAVLGELLLEMYNGLNITLVSESSNGAVIDRSTMQYDGCLGSLQANESDTLMFPANLPIIADNFSTATVYSYDKIGMLSAYEKPDISKHFTKTHVLDMVCGFSPMVWIVLLGLLVLILAVQVFALNKRRKKRKRYKKTIARSYRILIGCILDQHSSIGARVRRTFTSRLLYSCATFLCFYSSYYLTSMIKTEMVIVKPPFTIESYDELIQSNRRPLWIKVYDDYTYFSNAAQGSKEQRIWEIAVEKGINESIVPADLKLVIIHAERIGEQEEVFLLNRYLGSKSLPHACAFSRSKAIMTHMYPIFRYDSSAKEILRGTFQNILIKDKAAKVIHKNTQRIFQSQLMEASSRFFSLGVLLDSSSEEMYSAIRECSCNVILIPTPELRAVFIRHYVSLFILTLCLIILCHAVLIYERSSYKSVELKTERGLRPLRV
jgi:hypothetical protein